MKTIFRSKYLVSDAEGANKRWVSAIYVREQPKVNHREYIKAGYRKSHADLTAMGAPRRLNGQKLGLKKREALFNPLPF